MELYQGRPAQSEIRAERETRTYDLLDRLGISYGRVDHAPALTMEDCLEIDRVLGVAMCKNLFLCNRQKTDFYLLMMPGDKPFRTKELSAQLGTARLSFADETHMAQLLDILPGAVSVMGIANDKNCAVQLIIDEDVLKVPYIGCHPCVNTSSLKIATADILERFLPETKHSYRVVKLIGQD